MSVRLTASVLLICTVGCASTRGQVRGEYADPQVIEILTDEFSENDLQLIARRMSSSLSSQPHFQNLEAPPRLVVGRIANNTGERIDVESLADKIQVELFKSGRFELLNKAARVQIAEEYEYQQSGYVDPAAAKGPGAQYAAEYIVTGSIAAITQQSGSTRVVHYKMSMVASHLGTGVVRWAEEKELRKKVALRGISPQTSGRLKGAGVGVGAVGFATGTGLLIAGLAHSRPERPGARGLPVHERHREPQLDLHALEDHPRARTGPHAGVGRRRADGGRDAGGHPRADPGAGRKPRAAAGHPGPHEGRRRAGLHRVILKSPPSRPASQRPPALGRRLTLAAQNLLI